MPTSLYQLCTAALLLVAPSSAQALRVDTFFTGTTDTTTVKVRALIKDPAWHGPALGSLSPDNSSHHLLLEDAKTGKLLFRFGFSTLLEEWQTLAAAKGKTRVFPFTFRTPWPKRQARLRIEKRGKNGKGWVELLNQVVKPKAKFPAPTPLPPCHKLVLKKAGRSTWCLDILVIGDGYTKAEGERLQTEARRLTGLFMSREPFRSARRKISIRVAAPHAKKPGPGQMAPLGSCYGSFGMDRYVLPTRYDNLATVCSHFPADIVIIMVNTTKYGGAGVHNLFAVTCGDHRVAPQIVMHEVGHLLAGLADEYVGGVTYVDIFGKDQEPWEPNITRQTQLKLLKWRHLVTPGTPLPTPASDRRYRNAVGCFEGAGYTRKGMYRPCLNCTMRSLGAKDFCPVCQRALARAIKFWTRRGI